MPTCNSCKNSSADSQASFCSRCGAQYLQEEKLPYLGESKTRGIYRVTFPPQEGEFDHLDAAQDAIRHSAWGEDREFVGEVKIEFVRKYRYYCDTSL